MHPHTTSSSNVPHFTLIKQDVASEEAFFCDHQRQEVSRFTVDMMDWLHQILPAKTWGEFKDLHCLSDQIKCYHFVTRGRPVLKSFTGARMNMYSSAVVNTT